uniref:Aryphorin type 2 n=1 Tax=Cerura vinula TaxID=987900 RepID=U3KV63_9NEOP|nr:aryphorin type 2 [Cerura vinula]
MKTVLVFAGLIALALGTTIKHNLKTKEVGAEFVARQKKVLDLFENTYQLNENDEYYTVGKEYSIEANIDNYTNKKAVEDFLQLYRTGFLPKGFEFSVFYERLRDEAIALFEVFYYAKDFETFYKTAAFAKVHLNDEQFLYALYIAVLQRPDTDGIVLPAPYEVFPQYFVNKKLIQRIYGVKMQKDNGHMPLLERFGVFKENEDWVFYTNYSNSLTYPNDEQRLSYFTEDVGLNSYYYYFHSQLPFWWNTEKFGIFKERRGEIYFYFYQQLLARYYLERLSNGLGEVPEFSWYSDFKTGYYPFLSTFLYPFAQRSNNYEIHNEQNYERIRFLDTYEKTFFQYLQSGHFKAFDKEVDFHSPKALNFVGNYWQNNADLYSEEVTKDYQHSYEITARRVLGAGPEQTNKYMFLPTALDFYQTSLRDPAFYQLYSRILKYLIDFKEYLTPYTKEELLFPGVKIEDVKVDKLVTYFDYFDFNITNKALLTNEELKGKSNFKFIARQPRLNNKPFTVTLDVKSEVSTDAVFKIFLGPKYDSNGRQYTLEEDWSKFYELDWFIQKIVPGENKVVRKSTEFVFFKEDSVPISEIENWLGEGKVPFDQSSFPGKLPRRLMLPKGTNGGYPFQLFVSVYPYKGATKEDDIFKNFILDNKPFSYPLDRPVLDIYFEEPNSFFEEVVVYHEDASYYYESEVSHYMDELVKQTGNKYLYKI